jgi:hypothetical protein
MAIERWILETSREAPWNGIAEVAKTGAHGLMDEYEAIAEERHDESDGWSMEAEFYTGEDTPS